MNPTDRRPLAFTLLLLLLGFCTCVLAQNRTLEIEDLVRWNKIENEQISADGRYVLYSLTPDVGDPTVVLYTVATKREQRFPRLHDARFTYDGRRVIGLLKPTRDTVRQYKRDDKEKKLKGMDSLFVLTPGGQPDIIPGVHDFRIGERWSDNYAYTTKTSLADSLAKGMDKDAKRLVVRSFTTADSFFLEGILSYELARDAPIVLAYRAGKDSTWNDGVFRLDTRHLKWQPLSEGPARYAGLTISNDGKSTAFLRTQKDSKDKQPPFDAYLHRGGTDTAEVVSANGDWIPRGYRISDDRTPGFSPEGDYLFVGTTPRRPERDTNLLDEDVPDVEVWTTEDQRLYTQENVRLKDEKKRTYLAAYNPDKEEWRQIGSPAMPEVELPEEGSGRYVLSYDERPYLKAATWEGWPIARDMVVHDLERGRADTVATAEKGSPEWSPGGRYLIWYNPVDTAWKVYDAADREVTLLSTNRVSTFYDEENDVPADPRPYGIAGWLKEDAGVLVYDRYDVWMLDPEGSTDPHRIIQGRDDRTVNRLIRLNREDPFVDASLPLVQTTFEEGSRRAGFSVGGVGSQGEFGISAGPYHYRNFRKARQAEVLLYTRESFTEFPDLRLLRPGDSTDGEPISNANPQQSEFAWGTMEPYTWTDNQGRQLNGLLVKPPGFDPAKKYPMLVNFYERSSEGLFRHRAPYPHRSTINYSYYANRGYLIFNPDVIYREGYPGESAYDCVMSGVTKLIDEGFVDRARIGLQGHSWGGYQAAYLATKTDLFAAIESGAPVVNMFSAYGGIRWGSGLSRQFQYEKTQSRIGGSPWEYPLRYLENSPIFTTDKINSPILILHNDNDGAVPWYQGIEWFTALRRLGKDAWMLNYRGEPHWPLKPANREDFQRRMSQFFDHYLMDGPLPGWMRDGVKPVERGIEQGYEASRE